MSLKKVYEYLEAQEGGKDILETLKVELEGFREQDAKIRLTEKEIRKLNREIAEYEGIKAKLDEYEIDANNLDEFVQSRDKGNTMSTELKKMQTQIKTLQDTLSETETRKKELEQKSLQDQLKSTFTSELSPVFGRMADVLVEREILKGNLKLDEEGNPVYETEKGLYDKTSAIELIKKEYKDHIIRGKNGSNLNPSRSEDDKVKIDYDKLSASELLQIGLKQRSQG